MLTAQGIIGKIVSLIAGQATSKIVGIPFDKRKKACRSLTRLYYCIQSLDEIVEYFEQTLIDFEERGSVDALFNALNNHSYQIELVTNMFIDLGFELHEGLEIIDPALAKCCHLLYVGKFNFLTFLSNYVNIEWGGSHTKVIKIKKPKEIIEAVDIKLMYENSRKATELGEKFYWPSSAFDDFHENFEDIEIYFEDDEIAIELCQMIIDQNKKIKEAKEKLRIVIKENFSIEEILFQSDSKPEYKM